MEWRFEAIADAGVVGLSDGVLACGDPWWSFEGIPLTIELTPGDYSVRIATAVAQGEKRWRECAAAELLVDPSDAVVTWELAPVRPAPLGTHGGYLVEVGMASFGSTTALNPGLVHKYEIEVPRERPCWDTLSDPDAGSLVYFTVGPQHQECLTWVGRSGDGRIVRVLTDLGLLDYDPTRGALPWSRHAT